MMDYLKMLVWESFYVALRLTGLHNVSVKNSLSLFVLRLSCTRFAE